MIAKRHTLGLVLLAAVSLGTLLTAGNAARAQTSASTPMAAIGGRQVTPDAATDRFQRDQANSPGAVRLGLISKTTALLGRKVMTRQEKGLGRVDDLILDLSTGQVVAALVSARADDQLRAVPAQSFWTASKSKILLNTDRTTFESAPWFPKGNSTLALDPSRLTESFRHFGQRAPEVSAPGSGGFCSALGLVGLPLLSQTREPLGKVEDFMVDVPVSRIAYLLIQPAASAAGPNTLYVTPPQSVRIDSTGTSLVLKADQARFLAGPHFQSEYWTEMATPELMVAMLQHYDLQPEGAAQSDPTRVPARARIETPGVPSQAAPARSDQEITVAVVTEIVRISGAFPTRELKITTTQGRVTLSGRVRTENQKRQLGDAAARVVGLENVDNQLNNPPNL